MWISLLVCKFVHRLLISVPDWVFVSIPLRLYWCIHLYYLLPDIAALLVISRLIQGWLPVHDTRGKLLIQPMPVRGHKGLGLMQGLPPGWLELGSAWMFLRPHFVHVSFQASSGPIKIEVHLNTTWNKCIMIYQTGWIIVMSHYVGHSKRRFLVEDLPKIA